MTVVTLILVDCMLSLLTLGLVVRHHRMSVSGPFSAASRLMVAMTDLRARLDMLESIVIPKGGS